MVRINIIEPWRLADQHLIAEYLEIIMLIGSVRNSDVNFNSIPDSYKLGKGHINFFKNKILYLKKRHSEIKDEMKRRNFKTNVELDLRGIRKGLIKDWRADEDDKKIIVKRIKEKIKMKENWYRYYGKIKGKNFLFNLLNDNFANVKPKKSQDLNTQ